MWIKCHERIHVFCGVLFAKKRAEFKPGANIKEEGNHCIVLLEGEAR